MGRLFYVNMVKNLKDLAQAIDLVIFGLAGLNATYVHLVLHELFRLGVAGDIADSEINSFFDDQLIATDIRHVYLFLVLEGTGALVFGFDGVHQDLIGLFRKGKEAQLGIVKDPLYKMELDQHFLAQQLGTIKKYLMILEVIDIFQLERRHACFPDDLSRGCSELYILWCDDGVGEIGEKMFL